MAVKRGGAVGALYGKVGAALRSHRSDLGLNQEELAQRVGLSRASIANIECGRQAIALHHLVELAEALGTTAAEVLRLAEPRSVSTELLPEDAPAHVRDFVLRSLHVRR